MSNVVVIGGGLSGAASAVRLAKLGYNVTLVERNTRVGGALVPFEQRGFTWSLTGDAFTLPATFRDLFKKSGRPLDRELELVELPVLREHRFADGTRVALPGQSRTGVAEALAPLGKGLSDRWLSWTDSHADTWELVRKHLLERRYSKEYAPRQLQKLLRDGSSLAKSAKSLKDKRLQQLATYHSIAGGNSPDEVPAWMGFVSQVEQTFGAWAVPGGPAQSVGLLERRLRERGVQVVAGATVSDVAPGRVRIGAEVMETDAIVVACDPRALPSLSPYVKATKAAPAPDLYLLAVDHAPRVPHQIVLHLPGALVTIDTTGPGPGEDKAAWTVSVRGRLGLDVRELLAAHELTQFSTLIRHLSPEEQVGRLAGSPYGVQWHGRKTSRLGIVTPIEGVYAAGAHTTISSLTPFVVLTSALVAAEFDKIPNVR